MIVANQVVPLIEEIVSDKDYFLVDLNIQPGNKIYIYLDSDHGIKIEQCVEISRLMETKMDRDVEDFELIVSSAGLERPLKVKRQYIKNIGQKVEVLRKDGVKTVGKIHKVIDKGIEIELETKKLQKKGKPKGDAIEKPVEIPKSEVQFIDFEKIKTTKIIVDLSRIK